MTSEKKVNKGDLVIATILYVIVIIIFVLLVITVNDQKRVVKDNILPNNNLEYYETDVEDYYFEENIIDEAFNEE